METTIIEQLVNNAGDNVHQLVAAVKGQRCLKKMEKAVRDKANKDVENFLLNNDKGTTFYVFLQKPQA